MEPLKPLGLMMAKRMVEMLGGTDQVEGYGKGALIGEAGELEHGALWHAPGGYAMRELLDNSNAIVPSTKKVAGIGAHLDVLGPQHANHRLDGLTDVLVQNGHLAADQPRQSLAASRAARPRPPGPPRSAGLDRAHRTNPRR